jgi:hypothetical protein
MYEMHAEIDIKVSVKHDKLGSHQQSGKLPGSSEPNPKGNSTGQVAAMNLRSGG